MPCRFSIPKYEDIKMCNCSECGVELVGLSERDWYDQLTVDEMRKYPSLTAARVHGRPFCKRCLESPLRFPGGYSGPIFMDDPGPWEENAVRAFEDRFDN